MTVKKKSRRPIVSPAWIDRWRRAHRAAGGSLEEDVVMLAVARAIDLHLRARASVHSAAAITSREYPDGILQMAPEPVKRPRNRTPRR